MSNKQSVKKEEVESLVKKEISVTKTRNFNVEISADANKALDQILNVLEIQKRDTNAVIYNDTDETVQFDSYNDSDDVKWMKARSPICPAKTYCLIDKGIFGYGPTIQINVKGKDGNYYIKRDFIYIWTGKTFIMSGSVQENVSDRKINP
jgi:hypothetical protein